LQADNRGHHWTAHSRPLLGVESLPLGCSFSDWNHRWWARGSLRIALSPQRRQPWVAILAQPRSLQQASWRMGLSQQQERCTPPQWLVVPTSLQIHQLQRRCEGDQQDQCRR
jgi:hypothetical protein